MGRDWKGKRDYWLDHYGQHQPGQKREASAQTIAPSDYIAIPIPLNAPTPLAFPCLIWRWGLGGRGYGAIGGRYAHVVAYEQSRDCAVSSESGEQVNHLCHRPFCVQPAHLYMGDAQSNAEDRKARGAKMAIYQTWAQVGDRYDKAMTEFYWEAPEIEGASPGFGGPLACPHDFDTIKSAGDARICSNCGDISRYPDEVNHRKPCWEWWSGSPRCWCEPCCCRKCLQVMLGPAQRALEKHGGWPVHTLGGLTPEDFFDPAEPMSREDARDIRAALEVWARTSKQAT